jgi:pilus assembly protein Flp/PilA
MQHHMRTVRGGRTEETGTSAVEYALLVALIAAIVVVAVFALGGLLKTTFQSTCTTNGAGSTADSCEP